MIFLPSRLHVNSLWANPATTLLRAPRDSAGQRLRVVIMRPPPRAPREPSGRRASVHRHGDSAGGVVTSAPVVEQKRAGTSGSTTSRSAGCAGTGRSARGTRGRRGQRVPGDAPQVRGALPAGPDRCTSRLEDASQQAVQSATAARPSRTAVAGRAPGVAGSTPGSAVTAPRHAGAARPDPGRPLRPPGRRSQVGRG
jgi:hypothetical protein